MTKQRLLFKGVSEIVGTDDLGILILVDESGHRQISIVCDRAMAVQIELRLKHVPISSIMLPEVLVRLLQTNGELGYELIIEDLIDGQYRAVLYNTDTFEPTPIRVSDAVLLSLISNIPIYIETGLMQRQSVPYVASNRGVSLPVNTISPEMLRKALDKAIADENYELASHLRDEMRRRNESKEDIN